MRIMISKEDRAICNQGINIAVLLGLLFVFGGFAPVSAQTLYFDSVNRINNTYDGGSGPWDGSTLDWRNNGNTANVAWANGNLASFQGAPGNVVLNAPMSASGLQFSNNNGGYRISGTGALTLTGAAGITLASDGFSARIENNITLAAPSQFTNNAGGI